MFFSAACARLPSLYSFSELNRYCSRCAARFGIAGAMPLPSRPWQALQSRSTMDLPAAASPAASVAVDGALFVQPISVAETAIVSAIRFGIDFFIVDLEVEWFGEHF